MADTDLELNDLQENTKEKVNPVKIRLYCKNCSECEKYLSGSGISINPSTGLFTDQNIYIHGFDVESIEYYISIIESKKKILG